MNAAGPDEALDARYGRRPAGPRWTVRIAVGIVALAGVAWVLWAAWGQTHDSVIGTLQTYRVESDRAVRVTVTIDPDGTSGARCTVQALASDHTTVGQVLVLVPAGVDAPATYTRTVKTERRATSVQVTGCR